jgi:hypothetical protein
MPDPDHVFLIKVMQICNRWSTDPSRLLYERSQPKNLDSDSDPDRTFHSDVDPASQNGADPDLHHYCLVF